ncbi:MarR family transcriptional regulator, partial [Rickettsiales bacterium]|nr:MarR family transcriptional regulator [Rickettsiales bacterium]
LGMNKKATKENKIENEGYDLRILQSLRKIIRSVDIHSRKLSTHHDITAPQLITLLAIIDSSPLTIASISKDVHLSPSTLVGIIDRLEAKGYVKRERSEEDRRQIFISATKEGIKFARQAPSPLQETLAYALSKLSPLEQSTISLSLERIVELMEAKEVDASPILETGSINPKEYS